ncbi:heterokaryon incompatibility protein [Xylariales sp. AK1849]|nr:heterokaryon incompatibility protein [Xylariales sp. AK1849]
MASLPSTKKYKYSGLPPRHIRVLELQPEPSSDIGLKGRLVTQLIEDVPYEALSYVWGKPTLRHSTITCQDGADGEEHGVIVIGANLTKALIAIRPSDRPRRIWVDAICINQEDLLERQAQVRMMGDVFRSAEQVVCWLGGFDNPSLDEPAALMAIAFLRQFNKDPHGELSKVQGYLHNGVKSPEDEVIHMSWLAIKILFDIEYFHRAWIIQEVGLAQRARLTWGRSAIHLDWTEVAVFARFMDDHGAIIITTFDLKSWVVNHINLVWALKPGGEPLYDFSEILHWARIHISTDPRDYVYALLGHPSATIAGNLIIEPKYTIPTTEVYTNLATNVITATNSLHILAFVDHGEYPDALPLPTWVPDWHGPNLVAPLRYPTQAAQKVVECISIDPQNAMVRCRGYFIDEISAMTDMINPKELAVKDYEAEQKKQIPYLIDHIYDRLVARPGIALTSWQQFIDSLSATLTGAFRIDVAAHQAEVMHQQRADCAAFTLKFEEVRQSNSNTLGFLDSLQPGEKSAVEKLASGGSADQFVQDVTWTSMCRRVFRTAKGHIGLGPRTMRKDDVCAVVLGSIYPLVLRKHGDRYQLVGPALLYGFMDHEAEEACRNGHLLEQDIYIV